MKCRSCDSNTRYCFPYCQYCGAPMHNKGCMMQSRDCGCDNTAFEIGARANDGDTWNGEKWVKSKKRSRALRTTA